MSRENVDFLLRHKKRTDSILKNIYINIERAATCRRMVDKSTL